MWFSWAILVSGRVIIWEYTEHRTQSDGSRCASNCQSKLVERFTCWRALDHGGKSHLYKEGYGKIKRCPIIVLMVLYIVLFNTHVVKPLRIAVTTDHQEDYINHMLKAGYLHRGEENPCRQRQPQHLLPSSHIHLCLSPSSPLSSAAFNKRKVKVTVLDWPNNSECGVTFPAFQWATASQKIKSIKSCWTSS